jgi:hypothetical protein
MSELHCCGIEGFKDFAEAKAPEFHKYANLNSESQRIPEACCKLKPRNQTIREEGLFVPEDNDCITTPTTWNSYMDNGCYDTIRNVITENLNMVIGIAAAIIGLQILFIIFAFCLCKAVGHDHDYRYKY